MAKGERRDKSWRLVLRWRITFVDGAILEENWPIQVPKNPINFWMNLVYRAERIQKSHQNILKLEAYNPVGPSFSVPVLQRRNEFGIAKLAYRRLVESVTPKCPHCGEVISLEEFGK